MKLRPNHKELVGALADLIVNDTPVLTLLEAGNTRAEFRKSVTDMLNTLDDERLETYISNTFPFLLPERPGDLLYTD